MGSEHCICWGSSGKQPIQKDCPKGFNEGTSCRGADRLTELTRGSGHPGTNDSRKLTLVLGLMRTKGRSGVIGTDKLCSPGGGAITMSSSWMQSGVITRKSVGSGDGRLISIQPLFLPTHHFPADASHQPRATGSQGWGNLGKTEHRGQLPGAQSKGCESWRGQMDKSQDS